MLNLVYLGRGTDGDGAVILGVQIVGERLGLRSGAVALSHGVDLGADLGEVMPV